MKKKIVSVLFTSVLIMSLTITTKFQTQASDNRHIIDGSYLTQEDESTGTTEEVTKGEDLLVGYSKVLRLGPGKIYAGGTTVADHEVESVKVLVMVERAKWEDEEWEYVDSWEKESKNDIAVMANRELRVDGDWYYRVRSIHSAGKDMSSSFTNGIYIEEP